MNINEAFPSKYLKADVDVTPDEPVHLTIKTVVVEAIGTGAKQENKPVIYFNENKKGLVLNKTNATTITKLYGADTDDWTGKRITLLWKEVEYQGEMQPGIRVSLRAPAAAAPATPKTDRQRYEEFCAEHDITHADIIGALGTETVKEWMIANGRTLSDAFELILAARQPAPEIPF
jgi:hypothetical protein